MYNSNPKIKRSNNLWHSEVTLNVFLSTHLPLPLRPDKQDSLLVRIQNCEFVIISLIFRIRTYFCPSVFSYLLWRLGYYIQILRLVVYKLDFCQNSTYQQIRISCKLSSHLGILSWDIAIQLSYSLQFGMLAYTFQTDGHTLLFLMHIEQICNSESPWMCTRHQKSHIL